MIRTSSSSWETTSHMPPLVSTSMPGLATELPAVPLLTPPLDAHAAIHDVLRENARAIAAKRLKVSVRLLAGNHFFVGDRDRHRQAMQNLLRGAIASTPNGGHITVRSTRPTDCALRIEVEERSPWLRQRRHAGAATRGPAGND
jgi:hypothetical protein